jgi:signal transduction histidine kinase
MVSDNGKAGRSLYTLLGIIIVAVVLAVLGGRATYDYLSEQQRMTEGMEQSSALSLASLQKNITPLIEAYAINDYDKLIATEIELRQHFAIIVTDLNMGKIRAEAAYTSGKIRNAAGNIIDFNPDDPTHRRQLDSRFYTDTVPIISSSGTHLGSIAVYVTDEKMKRELNRILIQNLINTVVIALLLIALLIFAIHRLLVHPLARIAKCIGQTDSDGIPTSLIPSFAFRELSVLTDRMNTMILMIGRSRDLLHQRTETLSRSNAELNRLGEAMAHHFQEPARRLTSFSQRLQGKPALVADEDSRLAVEFIDQQARRLSELVRDAQHYLALDHAKVDAGGTADSAAALRQAIAANSATAQAEIVLGESMPQVRLAEKLLSELFAILLDNALRYSKPERPLRIEVSASVRGERAVFCFADNGSGIAPEYRAQVFDLFSRLVPNSVPGTGMGLALVRKIVQQTGGDVSVEDGIDGGACIVFDLPFDFPLEPQA